MASFDREQVRADLQTAGRLMLERELTWGNAGNISARCGPDTFLITGSGSRLGELAPDDLVECPVAPPAAAANAARKPSKELPMHRAIYAVRPDINVVLHAEPVHSTLIACTDLEIPSNWFISAMYYLERIERVPYHHPGSAALGDAVRDKARAANILLLEHHGVLVYDTTMNEAMMGLETLEMACRMLLLARSAQLTVSGLPPATTRDFLEQARYKPRRQWPV